MNILTPTLFNEAALALYPSGWVALADDLGVNYRTLRRWNAGTVPIPDGIAKDILALLQKRRGEFIEIENKLLAGMKEPYADHPYWGREPGKSDLQKAADIITESNKEEKPKIP